MSSNALRCYKYHRWISEPLFRAGLEGPHRAIEVGILDSSQVIDVGFAVFSVGNNLPKSVAYLASHNVLMDLSEHRIKITLPETNVLSYEREKKAASVQLKGHLEVFRMSGSQFNQYFYSVAIKSLNPFNQKGISFFSNDQIKCIVRHGAVDTIQRLIEFYSYHGEIRCSMVVVSDSDQAFERLIQNLIPSFKFQIKSIPEESKLRDATRTAVKKIEQRGQSPGQGKAQ